VKLWSVEDEKLAHTEAEALEALAGPGVPKLLGQRVFGNVLAVAMERCGEPVRHVESWSELCSIAEQVANTLSRVHQLGWVHHVKPSNILRVDDGQIKLSDWEGATKIGRIPRRHTDGYRAPETLAKEGDVFVDRSDVFSLGRTLQMWASGLSRKCVPVWWSTVEAGTTADDVNVRWSAQQLVCIAGCWRFLSNQYYVSSIIRYAPLLQLVVRIRFRHSCIKKTCAIWIKNHKLTSSHISHFKRHFVKTE
jgi:serine/threonine protein kinase